MEHLFSVKNIFFHLFGYPMSYLEFSGVIFGLIAVWLSAKANVISWPVGLANVILAGLLYYQVQLYPDMFLQIFFFVTNIIGWWRWTHPKAGEQDRKNELKVTRMRPVQFILVCLTGVAGTLVLGALASRLHEWFPLVFALPSAYPYVDSFILIMSIVGTFLMIQKKIECWILWIIIDIIATILYYKKGIKFYSIEYLVFTILAAFGLLNWIKESKFGSTATK